MSRFGCEFLLKTKKFTKFNVSRNMSLAKIGQKID